MALLNEVVDVDTAIGRGGKGRGGKGTCGLVDEGEQVVVDKSFVVGLFSTFTA